MLHLEPFLEFSSIFAFNHFIHFTTNPVKTFQRYLGMNNYPTFNFKLETNKLEFHLSSASDLIKNGG